MSTLVANWSAIEVAAGAAGIAKSDVEQHIGLTRSDPVTPVAIARVTLALSIRYSDAFTLEREVSLQTAV